jgi:hypothetical protein
MKLPPNRRHNKEVKPNSFDKFCFYGLGIYPFDLSGSERKALKLKRLQFQGN